LLDVIISNIQFAYNSCLFSTKSKIRKPWWNPHLSSLKSELLQAHHNNDPSYKEIYKSYKSSIRSAKMEYFKKDLQNIDSNPSSSTIFKKLRQRKTSNISPPANTFEFYFPPNSTGQPTISSSPPNQTNDEFNFTYISPITVKTIIERLKKNKSPGLDGITADILQHLPDNYINFITIFFNSCLQSSYFPTRLKDSKVIFIDKKKPIPESGPTPKNFRPLSLTPLLGRILEKLILNQGLVNPNYCSKFQHAFRPNSTTSHALTNIISFIQARKKRECIATIALDFSSAFDTISNPAIVKGLHSKNYPQK